MCTICLRRKPEKGRAERKRELLGLINSPVTFCLSQFWLGVSATPQKVPAGTVADRLLQSSIETGFRVQDVH